MKVISEISLRDFKFWSGGEDRAKNCTDEQLDKIESIMESDAPESGWTDDDINNFFWFDFDTIADWLGYKDEKHFDAGVREDDVKEAQDWFDGITDTEDMIGIAGFGKTIFLQMKMGKKNLMKILFAMTFQIGGIIWMILNK